MIKNSIKHYAKKIAKERFGLNIQYISTYNRLNSELLQQIPVLHDRLKYVRSPALNGGEADLLTDRLLHHPMQNSLPYIQLRSVKPEELEKRVEVADRLLKAYQFSIKEKSFSGHGNDMWELIVNDELQNLKNALEAENVVELAHLLKNFGNSFVWFGGITTGIDGYNKNLNHHHVALTYWDKLVCLGEYLGVLQSELPEAGPWGDALATDPNELVKKIEAYLNISIFTPLGVIHTDGLDLEKGVLHYRHINSLYSAHRMASLSKVCLGPKAYSEIGGGIGLTALYARRLGLEDYSIFDLPLTNVLSGHMLVHSCGSENVALAGEEARSDQIKVLPYWRYFSLDKKKFSITLNQDGLNEIDDFTRGNYRSAINRSTEDYFISLNHECFFPKTVKNLLSAECGYNLVQRSPYWLREGYVEELYSFDTRG